jgi:L-gulonolactone oxidase
MTVRVDALVSYSHAGPVMTIDPVSTGNPGWPKFLDAYNQFCIENDGKPLLNQTPRLSAEQLRRAYGEQLQTFQQARRVHDPDGRLLNPYSRDLLQAAAGEPPQQRPRPAKERAVQ